MLVEVIAGPIQTYFWVKTQALKLENAELSLDSMNKDLENALPNSIQIEQTDEAQVLTFRKIIYKGILLPKNDPQQVFYPIDRLWDKALPSSKSYQLYFTFIPSEPPLFYQVQPYQNAQTGILVENDFPHHLITKPQPFYLISEPVRYVCSKNTKLLEREDLHTHDKALLNNQIKYCNFSFFDENKQKGLIISLELVQKQEKALKIQEPIFFRESL